jgi:hypothetical protein
MMFRLNSFVILALTLLAGFLGSAASEYTELVPRTWQGNQYGCKCYFGDECWPKKQEWTTLNSTVDGRLFVVVPPEAVCHHTFNGTLGTLETYDAAACAKVNETYVDEQWR